MIRLLDTDVLIELLNSKMNAVVGFASLPVRPLVAGHAAMELLQGCQNAADRRAVEKLLRPMSLAWPSIAAQSDAYADYHAHVLSSGIGILDSLIAFTAVERNAVLVTFNVKHFKPVTVLTMEQPYQR